MKFYDLSAADAERYRACIEADGPIRLAELARLMRVDGVDLGPFDASLESLIPLWEWFIGYAIADLPGVALDARPRLDSVEPGSPDSARQRFVSEYVMHYLYRVAKNLLTDVSWAVDPHNQAGCFQRTTLHSVTDDGNQIFFELDNFSTGVFLALVAGRREASERGWLRDRALLSPFALGERTVQRILATPRSGVSILEGLGDPGPALPPLVFASVVDVASLEAGSGMADGGDESDDDDSVGDELMLAHPKANPEDMSRARALDAKAVAETLNALGCFTVDGDAVMVAGILAEDFVEYLREDNAAMFATESYRGKLRAVHVDAINPSRQQWDEIMTTLQNLAVKLKARLARSEEFYPLDEG